MDNFLHSRRRPITPWVVVTLTGIGIACVQLSSIENDFKAYLTVPILLLMLLALGIWVLFFSGMPWWRRGKILLGTIGFLIATALAINSLTRREGSYSGAGVPRLVWRWTPHRTVAPLALAGSNIGAIRVAAIGPDDFPQFLGIDRDNQVHGAHLARDWNANPPTQVWRRTVGAGWSGFSVAGNAAITMEQRGELESTICYNLQTGEPIWVHANAAFLHENEGGDGPRCTPTIDSGRVYTVGGLGNVDCLDLATGTPIWSRSLFADGSAERLRYGQTCSPLIADDRVIITGGHATKGTASAPSLWALDKLTGQPIWHCDGEAPSYASPAIVTLAGVRQILLVHQSSIAGHEVSDGHLLWQYSWPGIMPKTSQAIAVGADQVYASTGYGMGSVLLQIHNPSPAANASTEPSSPARPSSPKSVAVQSATLLWCASFMRTKLNNVVLRDHYIYGLDDRNLACQDAITGKKLWRRSESDGYGQILQTGDLLLVQSETGDVSLVDARPDGFTELGRISVLKGSNACWNPPTLAGHLLLIRSDREAACYRLP